MAPHHQAVWIGPAKRIMFDEVLEVDAGDEFEFDTDLTLGGEGSDYNITGGPAFDAVLTDAKALGVKGHTKMTTRLELQTAVDDVNEAAAAKAAADAAEAETKAKFAESEE